MPIDELASLINIYWGAPISQALSWCINGYQRVLTFWVLVFKSKTYVNQIITEENM